MLGRGKYPLALSPQSSKSPQNAFFLIPPHHAHGVDCSRPACLTCTEKVEFTERQQTFVVPNPPGHMRPRSLAMVMLTIMIQDGSGLKIGRGAVKTCVAMCAWKLQVATKWGRKPRPCRMEKERVDGIPVLQRIGNGKGRCAASGSDDYRYPERRCWWLG